MDDNNFTQAQLDRARATLAGNMQAPRPPGGFPFDAAFADAHTRNTNGGMAQALGATPLPLMSTIIDRERQQVHALMALHEEVCGLLFALAGESAVHDGAMRPMTNAETVYKGDPPAIGALGELAVLGSEQDKIIQCIRQTMTAFQAYI